jgi:hypothetical protein
MDSKNFKLQKMTINPNIISELLGNVMDNVSKDTIIDLKTTSPVDDTTPQKAYYYLKLSGKRAWIKDDFESRDYWKYVGRMKTIKGLRATLRNNNPAVISLALGFIFEEENINSKAVERTPDGKFSEQDPKGMFALDSIERALIKNNIKYVKKQK